MKEVSYDEVMHSDRLHYLVIVPVLVAAFFSFLYLDTKSFWLDEVYSVSFAELSWSRLWALICQSEANASPYYVLLKIWAGVFGDGEFAARSLSAIFGIGAVFMTCAIGVRLFDIRTGLAAGLILAVNAFFIRYAQEARGYTLVLLLVTFSMYLFIRAIESQQYKYYLALGLTNALVLYAHFCGFFVLVAQFISLVFVPPGTIRWKRALACAMVTASLASPLGVFMLTHQSNPLGWVSKPSLRDLYSLFKRVTGTEKGNFLQRMLFVSYFIPCFLSFVYAIRITGASEAEPTPVAVWAASLLVLCANTEPLSRFDFQTSFCIEVPDPLSTGTCPSGWGRPVVFQNQETLYGGHGYSAHPFTPCRLLRILPR